MSPSYHFRFFKLFVAAICAACCVYVFSLKPGWGQNTVDGALPKANGSQRVFVDKDPYVEPTHEALAVEGKALVVFDTCWKEVQKRRDMSAKQKVLSNYFVIFNEDNISYYFTFVPHQVKRVDKNGMALWTVGGATELGKTLRYTVNKKSRRITRVQDDYR